MNTKEYLLKKRIFEIKNLKVPYWMFHVIGIIIGIVLIILGTVQIEYGGLSIYAPIKSIMVSIGQALLVGMSISIVLDLPFMRHYYRNRIVDVLIGEEYLNSLSAPQLERLRSDCTEKIHIKDTTHFDKSLLDLDGKLTALLSKPYVLNQRCDIHCTKIDDKTFKKVSTTKSWIVNPSDKPVSEAFNGKVWLHKIEGKADQELIKLLKFKIKVDDGPEIDCLEELEYVFSKNIDSSTGYDLQVTLMTKNGGPKKCEYKHKYEIEIEDERIIPISDNIYSKRIVDTPVKNLIINYKTNGMDCRLDGNCFGTLSKVSSGQIRVLRQENSISIESFSWLLPGNGILIAALPKV